MMITAYFSAGGAPATGLSPTIDITDVSDGSLDINDGAMTELANGWYKYDFTAAVVSKEYTWLCDGGATLPDPERYVPDEWPMVHRYIQRLKWVVVNKLVVTEATGAAVGYKDDDTTAAFTVAAAFSTDGTDTSRKRLE